MIKTQKPINFFNYMGGKYYLSKKLLNFIPKHHCYVEVFGGSAKLLFTKEPSNIEVINDKNKLIANLFYVVSFYFDEFYSKISTLVYSRELFKIFREKIKGYVIEIPDIDAAVMTYYLYNVSFSGKISAFSFSKVTKSAMPFFNKIKNLPLIHDRLKNVIIENLDYEEIFKKYDDSNTFFYLDPPYYGYEKEGYYELNFSVEDHKNLLNLIKKLKGKWMLSGYDNELYQEELKEYNRYEFEVVKTSYGITSLSKEKKRPNGKEVIWFNYDI